MVQEPRPQLALSQLSSLLLMHRVPKFLVKLHGVALQASQRIHVCQATAIQDLLLDSMDVLVHDLLTVAGVVVALLEMDVIAQTMPVTLLTVVVMMTAVEVNIASVALMDTVDEVRPRFMNKAQPTNGSSTIQLFHPDTSRSIAEHCLLVE